MKKLFLTVIYLSLFSCKKDDTEPVQPVIETGQIMFFETNHSQHSNYDWAVVIDGAELGHINYCTHIPPCDTTGYVIISKPAGFYDITFRSYSGLVNQTRNIEIKANQCKKYDWRK